MITFLAGDDMRKSYSVMLRSLQDKLGENNYTNNMPVGHNITLSLLKRNNMI